MSKRVRNPKTPAIPPGKPEIAKAEAVGIEAQAQAAKLRRAQECEAGIAALLKKHNCTLGYSFEFRTGQPQPIFRLLITALDAAPPAPNGQGPEDG